METDVLTLKYVVVEAYTLIFQGISLIIKCLQTKIWDIFLFLREDRGSGESLTWFILVHWKDFALMM